MGSKKWPLIGLAVLSIGTAVLVTLSFLAVRTNGVDAEPAPADRPTEEASADPRPTTSTPRAPRASTIANIKSLLTGPDLVKIVVVGDSSGLDDPGGPQSWVTLWAGALSSSRPVSVVDRGSAYVPPTLGSGPAEPIQIVNASDRPGTLGEIVREAGELIPPDTDLVVINVGHNEADTDLRETLDSLWSEVPTGTMGLVMIQNPERTSGASEQRSRTQVVRAWATSNNVAAVDAYNAFLLAPESLVELLRSDMIMPNQRGAEIWRDAIIAALA